MGPMGSVGPIYYRVYSSKILLFNLPEVDFSGGTIVPAAASGTDVVSDGVVVALVVVGVVSSGLEISFSGPKYLVYRFLNGLIQ